METRYGIISDVHANPQNVIYALDKLQKEGIDGLILNGDLGENEKAIANTIFNSLKLNVDTYIQPGSHESLREYYPVIDYFSHRYGNLVDCLQNPKIEKENHDLIFLPGSDTNSSSGQFTLSSGNIPNGDYIRTNKGLQEIDDINLYGAMKHPQATNALLNITNMNNLKNLTSNPENTIVVCHIPPRFNNLEEAIDMAEFGESIKNFKLQGPNGVNDFQKGAIIPYVFAQQLVQSGAPIKLKKENRGNEDLTKLYNELGIRKSVSGHFHESGHRANDRNGNHVQEGLYTNELFWNSGCLDKSQYGILIVDGSNVKYHNLSLLEIKSN